MNEERDDVPTRSIYQPDGVGHRRKVGARALLPGHLGDGPDLPGDRAAQPDGATARDAVTRRLWHAQRGGPVAWGALAHPADWPDLLCPGRSCGAADLGAVDPLDDR